MPNYKGHIAGGVAAYALILYIAYRLSVNFRSSYSELIFWLVLCILGALFPDIDTKSKGQKIFYTFLLLIIAWSIFYQNWVVLSVSSIIGVMPALARHRGMSHSFWFVVFAPMTVPAIIFYRTGHLPKHAIIAYSFFVAGAISHLVLDFGPLRLSKRSRKYKKRYR